MGELVLLVARRRLKLDDIIISACISKVDGEYLAKLPVFRWDDPI
jgi:hypothetical protein